jgi:hypothetical protein
MQQPSNMNFYPSQQNMPPPQQQWGQGQSFTPTNVKEFKPSSRKATEDLSTLKDTTLPNKAVVSDANQQMNNAFQPT